MTSRVLPILVLALAAAACNDTPTAPTPTPPGQPPEFASQLLPGGTASRIINLRNPGTLRVTLTSVTPSAVIGLGVGIPRANGSGCLLNRSLNTGPGSTPQISVAAEAGDFCVQVYDPGTLTQTVSFAVTIAVP